MNDHLRLQVIGLACKHEMIYCCRIVMVRYTEEHGIEVYLETDDGYVAEWFPVDWISGDTDSVWMTIFDFCE